MESSENTVRSPDAASAPPSAQGLGYLVVKVSAARGAIPLPGASVTVRTDSESDPDAAGNVLAVLFTDADGKTQRFPLPAPPRTESMIPGNSRPYAVYHLDVFLRGYGRQSYQNVPIFDGITALQPVNLIPLPENGSAGDTGGDGDFTDTEPNGL